MKIPRRYHRIDGWRGFWIPGPAVAGASDTGTWSDSPCPSDKVKAEIRRFQRECLSPAGIKSRTIGGGSSNAFCGKRWVTVAAEDFAEAQPLAEAWMAKTSNSTDYIHSAKD